MARSAENDVPVHGCPLSGESLTPCCQRPVFELPRGHRITNEPEAITCWTGSDPRITPPERTVVPAADDCQCGHDHGVSETTCERCHWCVAPSEGGAS